MIQAKIIGATGYGGVGITELLLNHSEVEISCLVAKTDAEKRMSEIYPHLAGYCEMPILFPEDSEAQKPADIVFFATPDGIAMKSARAELDQGAKVIDYSGDFRFRAENIYSEYAQRWGRASDHQAVDLMAQTVYGLPELHEAEIAAASLVGNVGCFAIGTILGLAPVVADHLVDLNHIICDCKSGVSGAGKKAHESFHFSNRQDHMNAYRLTGHQHVCEIEQELSALAGKPVKVTFTTQVVPANRGILSCLYAPLLSDLSYKKLMDIYETFYRDHYFVRIFDRHRVLGTAHVRGSNFCNLVVDIDERTNTLRVISCIDNLMKGQAGNALQNMNILFGFPQTMGLDHPGVYP
ncbi:MAG: N-acetyl-gamma-glutamyl-phosphate reductase [Kiritimatiellae bacterium]|nr:N-acetyl-gamma-glutamyl-phosphate reductase [Kiritimatiellia bacterium]